MLGTGAVLFAVGRIPRPRLGWGAMGPARGLVVGLAQGLAVLPGVSRTGLTICAGMTVGLRRRWAVQFSFLIAVPVMCRATALEFADDPGALGAGWADLPIGPILAGALASLVSGYLGLRILLVVVRRSKLHLFSYYCWLAGLAVIFLVK